MTTQITQTTRIACFNDFQKLLVDDLEFFQYPMNDLVSRYGKEYMEDAVSILNSLEIFAACHGDSLEKVLAGYADYVRKSAVEYQDFQRNGRYRHTGQEELEQILSDPAYQLNYLYTLTLSTPLNRSRYELFKNYRAVAVPHLAQGGRVLEIGCGNCLDATFAGHYAQVDAYELNPYSACWQGILDLEDRVTLHLEWYAFDSEQTYDFVTMIEILEHLSEPEQYLQGAYRVLKNGGHAYLTFAVRMPQIDHLFQFDSVDECRELVCRNGFRMVNEFCTISTYRSFKESERWELANNPRYAVIYCCLAQKSAFQPAADLVSAFNEPYDLN
jgi:2-polyprenyl-3-methyl-5-hydroxy-6-metoxy-1,4-benzoquinol methylase